MIDIENIDGWKKGGSLAGRNVHKIIATDPETGGVLHIKISGPTRYQSTTYTVAVQQPGEPFPDTYVDQGIEDETEAKLKALQYAQDN